MSSSRQEPPLPVPEGTVIAGKYRVGRALAAGGMGVVAEGRHVSLDQRVAIKFLLPAVATQAEAVERFVREAKAAAKIASDNVVRVFDVDTHEGIPYLVMEYLDGIDLSDYAAQKGALDVSDAMEIVKQALEGLAEAHAHGIVHRDLKPSNLFLAKRSDRGRGRRVKILDFGISKVMPSPLAGGGAGIDRTLTSTNSLFGSPAYMSPEQVRSAKGVDARSDVWSLGVIMYELLSGETAFSGESIGDVFAKIREEPLAPLRTRRAEVPSDIEAVVMKCVERDREKRYADAAELLDALGGSSAESIVPLTSRASGAVRDVRALAEAETLAAPLATDDLVRKGEKHTTQGSWSSGGSRSRVNRWPIAAAVMGAAALAGVGAWELASSRGKDVSAEGSPRSAAAAPASVDAPLSNVGRGSVTVDVGPQAVGAGPPERVASASPSAAPHVSAAPKPSGLVPLAGTALPKAPVVGQPLVVPTPKKKDDLGI